MRSDPENDKPDFHWQPISDEDRKLVREELEAILSSTHFRTSRRYPAFLRHVVEASLDGRCEELKERVLGVEVFRRAPDYDTSTDPVVRASAGEVRKRIIQYYSLPSKIAGTVLDGY